MLLQLPPDLQAAPQMLEDCLREFPAEVRVAVEPRHESWWTGDVAGRPDGQECRAVLGGPERSRGHPAVADGGLGLPAVPRGRRRPLAALPRVVAAILGEPDRGDLAPKNTQETQEPQEAKGDVYAYFDDDRAAPRPAEQIELAAAVARQGRPL